MAAREAAEAAETARHAPAHHAAPDGTAHHAAPAHEAPSAPAAAPSPNGSAAAPAAPTAPGRTPSTPTPPPPADHAPRGGGPGGDADAPDPNRWKALAVCLVGGFMVLLDVSIVNVALKSIEDGLGASGDQIQWVLSGYALTFGLLLVPAGRIGDVTGRRRMFIIGLVLFVATSALCGAAPSATWLVIGRLAQGLAGGLLTPQISSLIQQLFSGRERGKAFGLFGATVGISTAIGPVLGGLLITAFGEGDGWRYVFYVNLPIGLIALPFALKLLPGATADQVRKKHDYDPVGVVLLGAGVVVLLLPFVQEQAWQGSQKWLLVPAAVVLLALFVLWEFRYRKRGHEPMVDLALFRTRSFSAGSSIIALYFAGFVPLFFVLTLLLQQGLGYSALLAGLASTPFAVGSGVAAVFGGRVVHRFGRWLIVAGVVMVVLGFVATVIVIGQVQDTSLGWVLVAPLLVAGIGSGLVISPNQTLTLSQVPTRQAGSAGGLLQVGQRIGSAIGIAAVGSVFYAQLADTRGDYSSAVTHGLWVAVGFLVAALLAGLADAAIRTRRTGGDSGADATTVVPERAADTAPTAA